MSQQALYQVLSIHGYRQYEIQKAQTWASALHTWAVVHVSPWSTYSDANTGANASYLQTTEQGHIDYLSTLIVAEKTLQISVASAEATFNIAKVIAIGTKDSAVAYAVAAAESDKVAQDLALAQTTGAHYAGEGNGSGNTAQGGSSKPGTAKPSVLPGERAPVVSDKPTAVKAAFDPQNVRGGRPLDPDEAKRQDENYRRMIAQMLKEVRDTAPMPEDLPRLPLRPMSTIMCHDPDRYGLPKSPPDQSAVVTNSAEQKRKMDFKLAFFSVMQGAYKADLERELALLKANAGDAKRIAEIEKIGSSD